MKLKNILLMLALVLMTSMHANAKIVVEPSGDTSGREDYTNIKNALKKDGDVVLVNGGEYYIFQTFWVKSNQRITATGATITSNGGFVRNKPSKTNYASLSHFTLDGGTWVSSEKDGYKKSAIQFSHANDITIKNATIRCNYEGHGIELIACKNVSITNCQLLAQGSCPKDCKEEQIQIDLATPVTAPTIAALGKNYAKGQTCQNITISKCTIVGARGICANYAASENKYKTKFHKNIILKNNKITGKSSEAVALFNVIGATIKGNKIVTKSKRTTSPYSVGCHIAIFGKAPASINKAKYVVTNNTIKGGREGLYTYSHSSSKFGNVIVKNNKCYAKAGANSAIKITSTKTTTDIGNTRTAWK